MMLVHNKGKKNGTVNSLNITVTIQIIAMLITILKSPRVIICKGNAKTFKMGFTKEFKSPKIIPKTKKICQELVMLIPKKLEPGNNSILTPGTNNVASQSPKAAAAICESSFFIELCMIAFFFFSGNTLVKNLTR